MAYVLLGNPRERGLNVKNNPEIPNGIKKISEKNLGLNKYLPRG